VAIITMYLPLKAARRDSVTNLTYYEASYLSCR